MADELVDVIRTQLRSAELSFSFKAGEYEPDYITQFIMSLLDEVIADELDNRMGLEVAIGEAVINAIDYGCLELSSKLKAPDLHTPDLYGDLRLDRVKDPHYAEREIGISLVLDSRRITVRICDPGPGVPPKLEKPKAILPHGRGLALMRGLVDQVVIRREPSVVTLTQFRK
jgi:signal transduction histidine kinase